MAVSNIRCLKMAATMVVTAAALATSFVMAFASGAAAAQSTDPPEIAERNLAATSTPYLATQQMSVPLSGVLTAPGDGPLAGHELHFQERVSGDIYTVRTHPDGSFSTMLPPGLYDLRGQHGAVIASAVMVDQSPVNLGQLHPPGPFDVGRLLERQEVGQAIVNTPAPATAYVPSAGEGSQPVAVLPIASPPVMGGGPSGQKLPPAVVIPPQIQYQSDLPAGAQVPAPGMPPAEMPSTQEMAPVQDIPPVQDMPPPQGMPPAEDMPPAQGMPPAAPGTNGSGY
jgi:hypothetical protein